MTSGTVNEDATIGTAPEGDPVLAALHRVEVEYEETRARIVEQEAALAEAAAANAELREALSHHQGLLDQERRKTRRERRRTKEVSAHLREIHAALFSGNLYDLILKACLTLTAATHGLYLTARGGEDHLRVRAAINMQDYPALLPSEFISALALRVIRADDESFTYNTPRDFAALPQPSRENERFHNCITASVVLLKDLDGVVIVADKASGDFDREDVDTLLHVGNQSSVAVQNVHLRQELETAYFATVGVLADAMEAKDPYTYGHAGMVARHCLHIAQHLGLPEEDRNVIAYAALLHDIGKIGVSDGILNKPGVLLPEERDLMRSHVRIGHDLLQRVPALTRAAEVLLHHHEWFDGSGYPDGLAGETIPLLARIVAVVDAYSAMITTRSYRAAISDQEARAELRRCAGTQFDPRVVDAFIAALNHPEAVVEIDEAFPGFAQLFHAPTHASLGSGHAGRA